MTVHLIKTVIVERTSNLKGCKFLYAMDQMLHALNLEKDLSWHGTSWFLCIRATEVVEWCKVQLTLPLIMREVEEKGIWCHVLAWS